MENSKPKHTLESLLQNPEEITELIKNPGKYGLDIYNGLSVKQQQYVLFAAGAGLIMYGIYLGRSKR